MCIFQWWFFQGICQVVGLLGRMVVLFLVFFKDSPHCSPSWLYFNRRVEHKLLRQLYLFSYVSAFHLYQHHFLIIRTVILPWVLSPSQGSLWLLFFCPFWRLPPCIWAGCLSELSLVNRASLLHPLSCLVSFPCSIWTSTFRVSVVLLRLPEIWILKINILKSRWCRNIKTKEPLGS